MMSEPASVSGSEHVHERLSEFMNGDLSDAERQAVEAHLRGCVECRRDFESLRMTIQLLRQVPLRPIPRSFTIPAQTRRRSPQVVWLRWSTGVLAATLVALLALRFVLPGQLSPATPALEPAASSAARPFAAAVPTSAPAAMPVPASSSNQAAGESTQPATAAPREAVQPLAASAQLPTVAPTPAPAVPGHNASGLAQAAAAPTSGVSSAVTPVERVQKAAAPVAGQSATPQGEATGNAGAAPTPQPVAGLRPLSLTTDSSASEHGGLPGWYTPALVAVGVLLIGSLAALIWLSRRV